MTDLNNPVYPYFFQRMSNLFPNLPSMPINNLSEWRLQVCLDKFLVMSAFLYC